MWQFGAVYNRCTAAEDLEVLIENSVGSGAAQPLWTWKSSLKIVLVLERYTTAVDLAVVIENSVGSWSGPAATFGFGAVYNRCRLGSGD